MLSLSPVRVLMLQSEWTEEDFLWGCSFRLRLPPGARLQGQPCEALFVMDDVSRWGLQQCVFPDMEDDASQHWVSTQLHAMPETTCFPSQTILGDYMLTLMVQDNESLHLVAQNLADLSASGRTGKAAPTINMQFNLNLDQLDGYIETSVVDFDPLTGTLVSPVISGSDEKLCLVLLSIG